MTRPYGGQVVERKRKTGKYFGLRFVAYGKRRYMTLGAAGNGWTRKRAEAELANVLADVRRGIWRPTTEAVAAEPREMPTFHEFASEWFERQKLEGGQRGRGLSPKGIEDLEWRLSNHLLPFFAASRLDAISVEDVDRYRLAKVRAGALGSTSINKTLNTLAAILETAVEYELIGRNPARGRRRRLPAARPARSWLDRAEHISALLDAAGQLDRDANARRGQRRALLATLVFAGLRIGEALALCWRDVDLAHGTLRVRASKTDAGLRVINVLPVLRDELLAYRARTDAGADALVFGTSTGAQQNPSNVRTRLLAIAVDQANERLAKEGAELLPTRLTPHALRRTFASVLFAIGETPPYVMAQMGHTTANLTLAIYARQMDRRDGEPERLRALVNGADWAPAGTRGENPTGATVEAARV